ncbi:MAG: NAD-dependent epimerase/dehydratase family protein [Candidatus Sericytochromatia bacterium]
MAQKILLTGHRGYIGACLYQHFSEGPAQVEIVAERLEELRPKSREADLIIHCAAKRQSPNPVPPSWYQSNELGTQCLLESMCQPTPILCLSSRMVYAAIGPESGWTENDPIAPQTAYGQSKVATEQRIVASGVPYVILRLSGVFGLGLGQWGQTFPEQVLRQLLKGETPVFSGSEHIRDYLYVWDLVKQIDYLIQHREVWPGIFNLSGQRRPVKPLLDSLLQHFSQTFGENPQLKPEMESPSRQAPPRLDIQKIQSLPGLPEWTNDTHVIQTLVQDARVRFGSSQPPACQGTKPLC